MNHSCQISRVQFDAHDPILQLALSQHPWAVYAVNELWGRAEASAPESDIPAWMAAWMADAERASTHVSQALYQLALDAPVFTPPQKHG